MVWFLFGWLVLVVVGDGVGDGVDPIWLMCCCCWLSVEVLFLLAWGLNVLESVWRWPVIPSASCFYHPPFFWPFLSVCVVRFLHSRVLL